MTSQEVVCRIFDNIRDYECSQIWKVCKIFLCEHSVVDL